MANTVRKMVKTMIMAPSFIVLAGATAGAAVAPSMNQSPVVGAFVGGLVVLVLYTVV